MFVFPLVSIGIDAGVSGAPVNALLIGKGFVFWSMGVRLLLAGLRQIIQPRYTAQVILGLKSDEPLLLVRELGFANVSLGTIGMISLILPACLLAAALTGAIFYGLAGAQHAWQPHRNGRENVAMVSDLFIAVVLAGISLGALLA